MFDGMTRAERIDVATLAILALALIVLIIFVVIACQILRELLRAIRRYETLSERAIDRIQYYSDRDSRRDAALLTHDPSMVNGRARHRKPRKVREHTAIMAHVGDVESEERNDESTG